ncbi:Subtilisin-like protease SBT3.18 [Glycine soja]|nr:Subtilisin-like protease SBT3.18 [Glycine max]
MRFAKILSSFTLLFIGYTLVNGSTPKHYIVYMEDHSHPNSESVIRANHEILASVTGRHSNIVFLCKFFTLFSLSEAKVAALHHYNKSFQGFSAMITPEQASQLAEYESVLSVFESKMNKLHTTHSWDFLGLETISKNNPKALDTASNVIVGEYLLKLNENY